MRLRNAGNWLPLATVFLAVGITYSNHFGNSFHFDDSHTVVDNPNIRTLRNIPRFFTDATTFSILPANRTYRPLVTASLAVDYWLGGGLRPFFFHLSTFFWFLVQLGLMFYVYRAILAHGMREAANPTMLWTPLFAVAWYGLHPAIADTVNYVIQRGEVFSTVGILAALLLYIVSPFARRSWLYLAPFALAMLSKQPSMIFPLLLFLYVFLFEEEASRARLRAAVKKIVPALVVTAGMMIVQAAMLPKSYTGGAMSAYSYRITQPLVTMHYFTTWFVPAGLTADTDRPPFTSIWNGEALAGFAFVGLLVASALFCARRRELRPVAFGILWFLAALLPAALFPLAEVENDHRMFLPFAGLAFGVSWSLVQLIEKWRKSSLGFVCGAAILAASALGTHHRNEAWRSEESLWYDVTQKSPSNGRGLMNYGLTLMRKGDAQSALEYFERAATFNPAYYVLEINRGIANGELRHDAKAEAHFLRAIHLAPGDAQPHFFYARFLWARQRSVEAIAECRTAIERNQQDLAAHYLLMEILASQHAWHQLQQQARQTLLLAPGDASAMAHMNRASNGMGEVVAAREQVRKQPTAENFLTLSLLYHQAGQFQECIAAARKALELRPAYAEAYNNIAAGYQSLGMWDQAIQAAEEALRINPQFTLARNNLAWSEAQKRKAVSR